MRKKYLINIPAAFCLMLFSVIHFSCKKDTGNYDYKEIPALSLARAGLNAAYSIKQNTQLAIAPVVDYSGDTSNLSYEWITYRRGLIAIIGPAVLVSTARELDIKFTHAPGSYFLEYIVTDKTTGVKVNARANLDITAGMEAGWLVLHSLDNKTEVDFITTKSLQASAAEGIRRNLFMSATGAKMNGEGRFISQTRRENTDFNFINIGTNTSFERMHGFTFLFISKDQNLFRRELPVINPQAQLSNSAYEFLINDGKLYPGYLNNIQDSYYSGPFRGDYYLEPYITCFNYNIYGAVVYDRTGKKFMYSTTTGAMDLNFAEFKAPVPASPLFDLNNMGGKLLYMETGFSNYTYAFFKNDDGVTYKLNVINLSKADDGNLAVASYDMSNLPEIGNALFFDVGTVGNVALYATEKNIYRYDYSGSNEAYIQLGAFPSNEVITSMKLFKAKLNANNTTADFNATNNTVLFVATWNGTEGKVYEYSINAANGVINSTPIHTYTGFGKVKDMCFKFRGTGT